MDVEPSEYELIAIAEYADSTSKTTFGQTDESD